MDKLALSQVLKSKPPKGFNLIIIYHMLSIVIQAGGQSRRMGKDKASIPFLRQTLIERVIQRILPLADEILVTTNNPQSLSFLPYPLVPDIFPGRGALGGVYTALKAASHPLVALVACDMPFVNPGLLDAQRNSLLTRAVDLVIPNIDGAMEPFHAVYRRETCLPHVLQAIQDDQWRVDSWFKHVQIHYFYREETMKYDPRQMSFWNVNTPTELKAALTLAQEEPNL